jgi:hypothetical protein
MLAAYSISNGSPVFNFNVTAPEYFGFQQFGGMGVVDPLKSPGTFGQVLMGIDEHPDPNGVSPDPTRATVVAYNAEDGTLEKNWTTPGTLLVGAGIPAASAGYWDDNNYYYFSDRSFGNSILDQDLELFQLSGNSEHFLDQTMVFGDFVYGVRYYVGTA